MGRPPNIFLKAQIHFRIGNQIIGCCKLANDTLGPIIFAEIGLALFSFAINAYFVCTFYSLFASLSSRASWRSSCQASGLDT